MRNFIARFWIAIVLGGTIFGGLGYLAITSGRFAPIPENVDRKHPDVGLIVYDKKNSRVGRVAGVVLSGTSIRGIRILSEGPNTRGVRHIPTPQFTKVNATKGAFGRTIAAHIKLFITKDEFIAIKREDK